MYCKKCGGKLESYASNCAFCGAPVEKYDANMEYIKQENSHNEVKHMTVWKWIGLDLINIIPVVGWVIYLVLMFKWAFGSTKDLSLKGYAKSRLLLMLIAIILSGLILMLDIEILKELEETLNELA